MEGATQHREWCEHPPLLTGLTGSPEPFVGRCPRSPAGTAGLGIQASSPPRQLWAMATAQGSGPASPGPEVMAQRPQEMARSTDWPSLTQDPRAEHLRRLQRSIGDQRAHIGCPRPPRRETKAQEAQGLWATASGPRAGTLE